MSVGQEEEVPTEEVVPTEVEEVVPTEVEEVVPTEVAQVQVTPGAEEAERILSGLQEVLHGKQVTCAFCGHSVSSRSIRTRLEIP